MPRLKLGDDFPSGTLNDIDGESVVLPTAFSEAPATVVFFYRGRW